MFLEVTITDNYNHGNAVIFIKQRAPELINQRIPVFEFGVRQELEVYNGGVV